jgi:hypothetical protein
MAVTRTQVVNAIHTFLATGGALDTAIGLVNADDAGPVLPSPVFYSFGERIIDKNLTVGNWIVSIIYDRKATLRDEPKYREEDWYFVVVGVLHAPDQTTANKLALKIEDAIGRALDAQTTGPERVWFGLDKGTVKDVEQSGSGLSPLDLVDSTFFIEAAVELRFRAFICRA